MFVGTKVIFRTATDMVEELWWMEKIVTCIPVNGIWVKDMGKGKYVTKYR